MMVIVGSQLFSLVKLDPRNLSVVETICDTCGNQKRVKDPGSYTFNCRRCGGIESLNELAKAPHHPRESKVDQRIKAFIKDYRWQHPRAGKEKIKPALDEFCWNQGITTISESTIGRIIKELKEKGQLPRKFKVSLMARTDRVIIREAKPKQK